MKDARICDNCGAEHPLTKMFKVEGDWLCEDCFDEHYVRCHDCGCILRSYDAYFDDDDHPYCSDCWDDHEGAIHDYNYTPDLVFHGKGLRHFGVELSL